MTDSKISLQTGNAAIDLALDTIRKGKQAIIFVNSKRGAEKTAEDLSKKLQKQAVGHELGEKAYAALSHPTKQCERLRVCLQKNVAFHHAGLVAKQRELIEDSFRERNVKIICATPSLAMGVDLPAYRAILRDVKRYGPRGLQYIPVLEYHQMAGRAGRPSYDTTGEAILIAQSEPDKELLVDKYINGLPEPIYSKLAVEPVLRTYLLSLIASRIVASRDSVTKFFAKTFWAHQYQDLGRLDAIIEKMLRLLSEWEFINFDQEDDFSSANELASQKITATLLGTRVAQLYIDPLTAHHLITCLGNATDRQATAFSYVHMICNTLEMRPLLRVGVRNQEDVESFLLERHEELLQDEPTLYDPEYEEFASSVFTAKMLMDWTEEKDEEFLLTQYRIRPGELKGKMDIADWLLFAAQELSKILHFQHAHKDVIKLRLQIQYGIKEELLPLVQLKNIGRIRARKLFANGIKDLKAVKSASITSLTQLIGSAVSVDIKKQLGQNVQAVPDRKRTGQLGLGKYS